jgi:hypothetical protein
MFLNLCFGCFTPQLSTDTRLCQIDYSIEFHLTFYCSYQGFGTIPCLIHSI